MGSGAAAVYSHQVCGGQGSFGGDSYSNGVIYLPCTNGTQALSYDASAKTFTPLWQGPSDAFGSPIVSGGLIWTLATGGFSGGGTKLYGLEPSTGKPRYTETLPSPVADHFASPSAAGGRVFVATGSTVSAFQIAALTETQGGSSTNTATTLPTPATASHPGVLPLATLVGAHLHAGTRGLVRLVVRCPAHISCHGTVTMSATLTALVGRPGHRHRIHVHVRMIRHSFPTHSGQLTLLLRLDRQARALLRRHRGRLHVTVAIALAGMGTRKVDALLTGPG
jgi:hypothetical protein